MSKDYKQVSEKQKRYEFILIVFKKHIDIIQLNKYGELSWNVNSIIYKQFTDIYEVYLMREII